MSLKSKGASIAIMKFNKFNLLFNGYVQHTYTRVLVYTVVVNAKALSIVRYQDDINTEHNMKTVCRAAVAQWKERPTRNGQTRVRIPKGVYF